MIAIYRKPKEDLTVKNASLTREGTGWSLKCDKCGERTPVKISNLCEKCWLKENGG
jgi:translation initiation factor 2 beta subunit (eIF-2beta)/eIF-5